MIIYLVTQNIGNYEERKFISHPFTDNEVFTTYFDALREAGWSRNWYEKEGFHEIHREINHDDNGEWSKHLVRIVLVNENQNQWVAIEVNKFMAH